MRRFTISLLSVFVVLPAIAGGRLPVVNIASGGVSARAAFGEEVKGPANNVSVAQKTRVPSTRTKRVVARVATPVQSVDTGEKIVATDDILSPRRPSNDLWAHGDSKLRMPTPDEFSVIRTDSILPEESLDKNIVAVPDATIAAPATVTPRVASVTQTVPDMDAQLARLNELQKRANESVRAIQHTPDVALTPAPEYVDMEKVTVARAEPTDVAPVSLHRMVVPMDNEDVVMRSVKSKSVQSPRIAAVREDMTKMNPTELRRAFRKTFLADNKHLSTFSIDSRFDTASDMSASVEGFTAARDLSEGSAGIRPLEVKISFRNADSALSRANYNLLTEYAAIVVNKPTRAIQIAIPQYMTEKTDERKLAARRLAIVEQALIDNGVSKQRIVPVLSTRDEPSFVLRIISSDEYETLTKQSRNMFGDTVSKKTYKSMSW